MGNIIKALLLIAFGTAAFAVYSSVWLSGTLSRQDPREDEEQIQYLKEYEEQRRLKKEARQSRHKK